MAACDGEFAPTFLAGAFCMKKNSNFFKKFFLDSFLRLPYNTL